MILIAGGTGRLGSLLVHRLEARGETVRVLTRDPRRAEQLPSGVEVAIGDVRDAASLTGAVAGAATVVSAVQGFAGPGGGSPGSVDRDGNKHLIDAAVRGRRRLHPEVRRRSRGRQPDGTVPHEVGSRAVPAATAGLRATIVRATAFRELWEELIGQTAGRSGRPLVFGKGNNPINFVSAFEVAACLEQAVC